MANVTEHPPPKATPPFTLQELLERARSDPPDIPEPPPYATITPYMVLRLAINCQVKTPSASGVPIPLSKEIVKKMYASLKEVPAYVKQFALDFLGAVMLHYRAVHARYSDPKRGSQTILRGQPAARWAFNPAGKRYGLGVEFVFPNEVRYGLDSGLVIMMDMRCEDECTIWRLRARSRGVRKENRVRSASSIPASLPAPDRVGAPSSPESAFRNLKTSNQRAFSGTVVQRKGGPAQREERQKSLKKGARHSTEDEIPCPL